MKMHSIESISMKQIKEIRKSPQKTQLTTLKLAPLKSNKYKPPTKQGIEPITANSKTILVSVISSKERVLQSFVLSRLPEVTMHLACSRKNTFNTS